MYRELDAEIINDLDVSVLASYCEAVAIYKAANAALAREGLTTPTREGETVGPYVKIMDMQTKNVIRLAEQLCMSPVGRARMKASKDKQADEDPMALLLAKGRGR